VCDTRRERHRGVSIIYLFCFCECVIYPHNNQLLMDRLSGDRQEMIKKCSSDRLRSKLVEAGYDSATVSKLDRTGLMETMAQLMMKQECFWAGF